MPRHSIRKYSERHIDNTLLEKIINEAMYAPTCGNMQLYTIIETRSEEGKNLLSPLHFNQPMVKDADVILTVCADFNRFSRWCELSKAEPGFNNFLSFISAMSDATIIAQQIVNIAERYGIGTCYLGTVTYNADKIAEALKLPDLVVPVACITLGWPAEEGVETERLPAEAIWHKEQYRADSDEKIMELFEAKDNYEANQKYIAENHKETLAQVFTDIRYTI